MAIIVGEKSCWSKEILEIKPEKVAEFKQFYTEQKIEVANVATKLYMLTLNQSEYTTEAVFQLYEFLKNVKQEENCSIILYFATLSKIDPMIISAQLRSAKEFIPGKTLRCSMCCPNTTYKDLMNLNLLTIKPKTPTKAFEHFVNCLSWAVIGRRKKDLKVKPTVDFAFDNNDFKSSPYSSTTSV